MADIRMRGPEGCANTVHWKGTTYKADKHGEFVVPAEARQDLVRHGFAVAREAVRDVLHLKRETPQ